jgi:hypothetical protein
MQAELTVGAIIIVALAGLGSYAYKLDVTSQPHPVVPDNHLPMP